MWGCTSVKTVFGRFPVAFVIAVVLCCVVACCEVRCVVAYVLNGPYDDFMFVFVVCCCVVLGYVGRWCVTHAFNLGF